MKKCILILVVAFFALTNGYSQELDFIVEDFNENEKIITVFDDEGYVIAVYFTDIDSEIDFTFNNDQNSPNDVLSEDVFLKNIYMPFDELGVMPKGVCFNSINNKIYFYGGQKILVYNAETYEYITDIKVSDVGIQSDYMLTLSNFQRRLVYNSNNNRIYCTTDGSELVVIDGSSDEIEKTIYAPEIINQCYSSLVLSLQNNTIYWIINTWFDGSTIKIIDCNQNIILQSNSFVNSTFDLIFNTLEDRIYLADSKGVYEYDLNLNRIASLFNQPCSKIELANNLGKLFVMHSNAFKYSVIDIQTGGVSTYTSPVKFVFNSKYNELNKTIYFTGASSTTSKMFVIVNAETYDIRVQTNNGIPFGLEYSAEQNKVYAAGHNKIITYYGINNAFIAQSNLNGCSNNNLFYNPSSQNIISSNKNDGTISIHDSNNGDLLSSKQIGGGVSGGCYNPIVGKYYIIQTRRNNENSFVSIIDGETNEVLNSFSVGQYIMSCAYNKYTEKVYITVRDGDNYKLLIFNDDSYSEVILPSPAEKGIAFTENRILIGGFLTIMSIDANTYQITTKGGYKGHVGWISVDADNNKVYVTSSNQDYSFILDDELNTIHQIQLITAPCDMDFNSTDEELYIGTDEETIIIDVNNGTYESLMVSGQDLLYHESYNKLYILSRRDIDYKQDLHVYNCDYDEISKVIPVNYRTRGITYNSINDAIYLHQSFDIFDIRKMNIVSIDCFADEVISKTYLNQRQCTGPIVNIGKHSNDLIFNSNENRMLSLNQGFSNISVVQCKTDNLNLQSGWNWLSFPRLDRSGNNSTPAIPVLKRINYFPELELDLTEDPDGDPNLEFINSFWYGELEEVKSTSGYKMELDVALGEGSTPEIELQGMQLDPETEMSLYPNQENWMGYFVDYPQTPYDCFDEATWSNLTMIKTQYWTMVKIGDNWLGIGKVTPFEYGDMVILKTELYQTFSWVNSWIVAEEDEISKTTFYSYDEQADYLPVYIEFDSISDVQEIAVIVDGEVKGAAVRESGDTIVEVNAYLEGTPPGATLEFDVWNGYKSSHIQKDEYIVYNPNTKYKEKRRIYTGESAQYHIVSFKKGDEFTVLEGISDVSCQPNPFSNSTAITFRLIETKQVLVEIFDINGKKIITLLEGELPRGYYTTTWNGDTDKGIEVNKGVYFYRISTGNGMVNTGKIVLI